MTIFEFDDYKDFLRYKIEENRGSRAYQSRLAEAIGCQKSFLSQVINSHVNFTPDHAIATCDFWGLATEESAYFVDLVLLARSGSRKLTAFLVARMKNARVKRADPSEKFLWPTLNGEREAETYYSAWYWAAIHIIVSIDQFESALAIATRLSLPVGIVESALAWLIKQKLIEKSPKGWRVTKKMVYLPNTSPMTEANHLGWRQRASANIQAQDRSALHYSAVFAVSLSDFDELKELTVEHIARLNKIVGPSSSEELVSFTCDLFKV